MQAAAHMTLHVQQGLCHCLHQLCMPTAAHSRADGMPWKFTPTQRSVKLHPGQSTLAFYTAENKADTSITGTWGQPPCLLHAVCQAWKDLHSLSLSENLCSRPCRWLLSISVAGVSTYNVAPQQAGQYFNKIQCFCFEASRARLGSQAGKLACSCCSEGRGQRLCCSPDRWGLQTPHALLHHRQCGSWPADCKAPCCAPFPTPLCRSRSCGRVRRLTCRSVAAMACVWLGATWEYRSWMAWLDDVRSAASML